METSGLDRLLSYARELGGVQAFRAPRASQEAADPRTRPASRSLQTDGVKLTLSGGLAEQATGPSTETRAATPGSPGTADATAARDTRPVLRGALAAYERAQSAPLGERLRIKA